MNEYWIYVCDGASKEPHLLPIQMHQRCHHHHGQLQYGVQLFLFLQYLQLYYLCPQQFQYLQLYFLCPLQLYSLCLLQLYSLKLCLQFQLVVVHYFFILIPRILKILYYCYLCLAKLRNVLLLQFSLWLTTKHHNHLPCHTIHRKQRQPMKYSCFKQISYLAIV